MSTSDSGGGGGMSSMNPVQKESEQNARDEAERGMEGALKSLSTLISGRDARRGETREEREIAWTEMFRQMRHHLDAIDVDVSKLQAVHVAGTKGKGSTCAMVERILRERGYRTGLFTSPHLVDLRERIRVDGRVLPEAVFLRHFWGVWDSLKRDSHARGMPAYFRFLTLLALKVFVEEKVDVAVLEVGIGGRLDATNVCVPVVTGVSSLGYDHMQLLGDTIELIAAEKAGIFKQGVPALVSQGQDTGALQVLRNKAQSAGAKSFQVVPSLEEYKVVSSTSGDDAGNSLGDVKVGLAGEHQRLNAALAVALCSAWETATPRPGIPHPFPTSTQVPLSYAKGLAKCAWPGRGQTLQDTREPMLTYFLDGAHTKESLQACSAWFASHSASVQMGTGVGAKRVLLFYCQRDRDPESLLRELHNALAASGGVDHAVFCPADSAYMSVSRVHDKPDDAETAWSRASASAWSRLAGNDAEFAVFSNLSEALAHLRDLAGKETMPVHALVTGSLYLVGDVLARAAGPGLLDTLGDSSSG